MWEETGKFQQIGFLYTWRKNEAFLQDSFNLLPSMVNTDTHRFARWAASISDFCFEHGSSALDVLMKILGPLLILLAFSIITFLTYQFFGMILPLLNHPTYSLYWCFHCFTALFLLFNVCYNYVYCVATRHTGAKYAAVCRELAIATNYDYPETEAELKQKEQDFEQKFVEAYRNRNRSRTNDTDDETDADVDADAAPPPATTPPNPPPSGASAAGRNSPRRPDRTLTT